MMAAGIFTLAGCATMPAAPMPRGPDLSPLTTRIDGKAYVPLNTVCRQYGLTCQWEPETQVAQIVTRTGVVRCSPGLSVAVVNGASEPLGAPVVQQGGQLWVPAPSMSRWIGSVAPPARHGAPGEHAIRTVVIDPGHGGHDAGAIGVGGLREKQIVLDVALRLQQRLEAAGIHVLMTRADDRFLSLDGRAAFANRHNADLFVSIHANSSRSRGASGYEVYYLSEATDDAARALAASENAALDLESSASAAPTKNTEAIVWDLINTENRTESHELASTVCRALGQYVPTPSRGVKSARFYVLKWAHMPSILIEVGFVTNHAESQRLSSSAYRDRLAEGIARSLLAYKQLYEKTDGFSN